MEYCGDKKRRKLTTEYMDIRVGGNMFQILLLKWWGQEAWGSENTSSWCLKQASNEERALKR